MWGTGLSDGPVGEPPHAAVAVATMTTLKHAYLSMSAQGANDVLLRKCSEASAEGGERLRF
jgi:hypothetical protein